MAESAPDPSTHWRRLGPPSGKDWRWRPTASATADWDSELAVGIEARYPRLGSLRARVIYSSVNDVAEVVANDRRYALKLYRPGLRSLGELRWEAALQAHLVAAGVAAMPLVDTASRTPWRLGVTKASVGPTLRREDLARVVDDWSVWADTHCPDR